MPILGHKLQGVPFEQAGTLRLPMAEAPSLLVIHYTATPAGSGRNVAAAFRMKGAKVSAHLVIDTDGSIIQCAEFNRIAAHAGVSSFNGRPKCNEFSIGIELVNPGPLELVKLPDGSSEFRDTTPARKVWAGAVYEGKHKAGGRYRYWAAYPPKQMAALEQVSREICAHYHIPTVTGHDDIAPGRKLDPGPAFDMEEFRARVL